MSFNSFFDSLKGKSPSEVQAAAKELYASMPPDKFLEHISNLRDMAHNNGHEDEREELVCRLLASGMPVEEIAVILNIRADAIRIIEHNNAATIIPDYTTKLKERRKRREKAAK